MGEARPEEREFWVFAVKVLFRCIQKGTFRLVRERVPHTIQALKAVAFDEKGSPVYETITGPVRALANLALTREVEVLEEEAEDRERDSPVHGLLGEHTEVTDKGLSSCTEKGHFTKLAFDLFKETGIVLTICAHGYLEEGPEEGVLPRNQAICAGLLVRITKFMIAVLQLIAETDRREVVMALKRSIYESATNLRFLVVKNEERFYDQFVKCSLAPERELYDIIKRNIQERGGKELPIERRMLRSVERLCRVSGVDIQDVNPKTQDWGGGLRYRLEELGLGQGYVAIQRIPSHAVHGTWADLVFHHLEEAEGGFKPEPRWSAVDARMLTPTCVIALDAALAYLERFFRDPPELKPLYRRIEDLIDRAQRLDMAYEEWLQRRDKEAPE